MSGGLRIAIVQFGDYREAYDRLRDSGKETYYAQKYSVDFVARLSERAAFVGVIAMLGDRAYEAPITDRLSSACVPLRGFTLNEPAIVALLEKWAPDRLILQAPSSGLLRWALKRRIETLPIFADSWESGGLRTRLRGAVLARTLNDPRIAVVGNHNVPASLSLRRIGVAAEKIVPWDWPHALTPDAHAPKSFAGGPVKLLYVGQLIEMKGCGDAIDAVSILKKAGRDVRLTLVGAGDFEAEARARIARLGLEAEVALAGRQSHDRVVALLQEASVALAPSRHIYSEGLPMTIYEALATRTPIVMTDHPMFRHFFTNESAARMVPEKNPQALADAVAQLTDDREAYARASLETAALWRRIKRDLTWGDLIDAWLESPAEARARLAAHALAAISPQ